MAPRLQTLPSELLLRILEFISTATNATPSLASLCLTSQRLRSLAEPYLYSSYSNDNHVDKPHLFPITLIKRPDLADHVRKLDLRVEGGKGHISRDTYRCFWKAIDDLNLPEWLADDWKRLLGTTGISRAAGCAQLSLLLASRKVERVSLQLSDRNESSAIGHLMFETPNWSNRFDQVQFISIAPSSENKNMDLFSLAYIFNMPNLRRVEVTGCQERRLGQSLGWDSHGQLRFDLGYWHQVQNSRVESIVLRASGVSHCVVNVLLNCCKAVRHLQVEIDLLESEWNLFQFFRLEDALCRHAKSLEYLAIMQDKKDKGCQTESGFRDSGPLSFLPRLHKLRAAVVPLRALTAIPDLGSIEIVSNEDGSPGNFFNEAEFEKYLPPSSEIISICNGDVHYGSTMNFSVLA